MRHPRREFWCPVVSEPVLIGLRRAGGFSRPPAADREGFFVRCSQRECQYVDTNRPPCPLHLGMFADELAARRRTG
jgi:hypothetical protein